MALTRSVAKGYVELLKDEMIGGYRQRGKLVKKKLFDNQPFKPNLPTDNSFKMTTAKDFEKEKMALIEMIGDFKTSNISGEPHPFFGKLTNDQWSKGTWKHLDHHLRQFGV